MGRLVGGTGRVTRSGLEQKRSQGKTARLVQVVERSNRWLSKLPERDPPTVVSELSVSNVGGRLGVAITNAAMPNNDRKTR